MNPEQKPKHHEVDRDFETDPRTTGPAQPATPLARADRSTIQHGTKRLNVTAFQG